MDTVRTVVAGSYRGILPRRASRILNCYAHPAAASVELTGAVIRQANFIKKMVDLGWTDEHRFSGSDQDTNVSVLVRSVARYHAFLDLMTSSVTFFVPTIVSNLSCLSRFSC